jgi:hypothetical protein
VPDLKHQSHGSERELQKPGIARVTDLSLTKPLGTAFAVSRNLAITAFHCVGDTDTKAVTYASVSLFWSIKGHTKANFLVGDPDLDYALVELTEPLQQEFEPLALGESAKAKGPYRSLGYPIALSERDLASITGVIGGTETTIFEGIPAIQLFSNESGAGLGVRGMSGAPVLAGDPEAAIGVIRWYPPSEDDPSKSEAGIVYATSTSLIRKRHPAVFPSQERSKDEKWKSYVDTLMEYAYRFDGGGRNYFFVADIAEDHNRSLQEFLKTKTVTTQTGVLVSNLPLEPGTNDLNYDQLEAVLNYCAAMKYLTRGPGGIFKEKFEITDGGRLYVVENIIKG